MTSTSDPQPDAAALSGTVLCIEDHPVNMELVAALVADWSGVRLLKAYNGRDGIQLAQTENPDIVLLDMRLPDIGGLEVVRALSEQISRRRMRVVLLTGESFSIEVAKAMSIGAHDYWRKPVDLAKLERALRGLLDDRARERQRQAH